MKSTNKFQINGEDVVLNGLDISLEENTLSEQPASCKSVNEKLTELFLYIGNKIGYSVIDYFLETNGYWRELDDSVSYVFKVSEGDSLTIKANSQNMSLSSFVGSIGEVGTQADYIGTDPWINKGIAVNTTYTTTVPAGANYLVVIVKMFSSDTDRTPVILQINEYDFSSSISDNLGNNIQSLNDVITSNHNALNTKISENELKDAAFSVTNDFGKYSLRHQLPYMWDGTQFVSSDQFGCYIMPAQWMHKYSRNKDTDYIYSVVELGSLDLTDIIESQVFTADNPLIVTNKNTKYLVFTCDRGDKPIIDDTYDNLIENVNTTKILIEENSNIQICTEYINGYNDGSQIVENDATHLFKTFIIPLDGDSWYTLYETFTDFVLLTDYPSIGSYEPIKVSNFSPYYKPYSFYVPENVKYAIGTTSFDTSYVKIGKAQRPLNIVMFGDSIVEFKTYDNITYSQYIEQYTKAKITNISIAGTRICARKQGTITEINNAEDAYTVLDLQHLIEYIIAGDYTMIDASNDWLITHPEANDDNTEIIARMKQINWNLVDAVVIHYTGNDPLSKLGTAEDMHNNTTLGELNYVIKTIQQWKPFIKVLIVTPTYFYIPTTGVDSDEYVDSESGKTQADYVNGELQVAAKNHCPIFNITSSGIFNKWNRDYYFTKRYGGQYAGNDGIHPWNGFEILGRRIGGWIREVLCL